MLFIFWKLWDFCEGVKKFDYKMALRRSLPSDIFDPLEILGSHGLNTWHIVEVKYKKKKT